LTRTDAAVILIILVLAALFALLNNNSSGVLKDEKLRIVIRVGGEIVNTADLSENSDEINIQTPLGYNIIAIRPDGAAVIGSDCPSSDCIRTGTISRQGQIIICLPHRLTIRVEGGKQGDFGADAVSK